MLRRSVRDFMKKECSPDYIRQLDEKEAYPYEIYKKMARLEWFGLPFPEKYGGSELSATDFIMVGEEMAKFSFEIAAGYGIGVFCGLTVLKHGSTEQIKKYIPKMIDNSIRLTIGITEPDSGSDAADSYCQTYEPSGSVTSGCFWFLSTLN